MVRFSPSSKDRLHKGENSSFVSPSVLMPSFHSGSHFGRVRLQRSSCICIQYVFINLGDWSPQSRTMILTVLEACQTRWLPTFPLPDPTRGGCYPADASYNQTPGFLLSIISEMQFS